MIKKILLTLIVLFTLVVVWAYAVFFQPSLDGQINKSIREARTAFNQADYTVAFAKLKYAQDSLRATADGITLNIAHTAYHTQGAGRNKAESPGDSVIAPYTSYYQQLFGSADSLVASIAYNQSGVLAADIQPGKDDDVKSTLREAASYFKSALKEDHRNEAACYNYELVQKKLLYPDILLAGVKDLVKQHRYREAHARLKAAIDKDPSMGKEVQEYLQRLETIINIDHD